MRRTSLTGLSSQVINYLIDKRGLTVTQIAEIAGVDKSFISRAKSAQRELAIQHLERFADHFNVDVGVLLLDSAPPIKTKDPAKLKLIALCDKLIQRADAFTSAMKKQHKTDAA